MRKFFCLLILLSSISITACSTGSNREMLNLQTAQDCLESFFALLSYGAYEQAASLYAGSYEELHSINPGIPVDNYAALWESACTLNGYQCLKIKQVLQAYADGNGVYHFLVEFKRSNGEPLVVGPCCGADATQMPPRSQFEFKVIRRKGRFLVQDMPIYVP